MTRTLAAAPPIRPLPEILATARQVNCGHCWKKPGPPCDHSPAGADGVHVARLDRAFRRGLVSGAELIAVLQTLLVFDTATLVFDVPAAVL